MEATRFQNATIGSPPRISAVTVTRVPQTCSTVRVFHATAVVRGLHPVNRVGPAPLSPGSGDAIYAANCLDNDNPHRHALGSQRNSSSGRRRPGPTRLGLEKNTGRVGAFLSSLATTDRSTLAASLGGGRSRNPAGDFRPIGLPGDHSASFTPPAGIGNRLQRQAKTPSPRADSPSLTPTPSYPGLCKLAVSNRVTTLCVAASPSHLVLQEFSLRGRQASEHKLNRHLG